MLWKE
jgi:hypothetical protein